MRKPTYPLQLACLTPDTPVRAGSWGTWTIRYTVPEGGIDDGGALRIALRFVSDWGRPQMTDPSADHYLTASCTRADTRLTCRWMERGNVRPYMSHLWIEVLDAPLHAGDEIRVVFGDTAGGGRGTRAQTFVQDRFDFQVSVDRFGTGLFELLSRQPAVRIVPNEPHRLVVIAGGDGSSEHPLRVLVKAEDLWGNPVTEDVPGRVRLSCSGVPTNLPTTIELKKGRFYSRSIRCDAPGLLRIRAEHPALGMAESNPVCVLPERSTAHRFWGDLHGQSGETIGTNSARQYFQFARDAALCDFAGHQGNDFQITDAFWRELNVLSRTFTRAGKFVVFPGYEWSGTTPIGGDRNVIFLDEGREIRRSSTVQVRGEARQTRDESPLPVLYRSLKRARVPVLLIPHIGGRRANLDFHDPRLEPVVEVHSSWGTFEWFYHEALRRGYRVGVVANSDGHKGRPGAEHAGAGKFGVDGGLTCILAESFNRKALFEALQRRRCYGTSGPRILVDATLDDHRIGSDLTRSKNPMALRVDVVGTDGVEQIDLLAAGKPVTAWEGSPYGQRPTNRIRIRWSGARIHNRNRATVWNGSLKVHGNKVVGVEGFAFDSPAEGIQDWGTGHVRWSSITTGDEDGLILMLAQDLEGTLEFQTAPVQCSIALRNLRRAPLVREAGGIEQRAVFERAPEAANLKREVSWTTTVSPDRSLAVKGRIPYHLRITQVDGHRAWTSSWFVEAPRVTVGRG